MISDTDCKWTAEVYGGKGKKRKGNKQKPGKSLLIAAKLEARSTPANMHWN